MWKLGVIAVLTCSGAAYADECDETTARVVQATGATFDHRSPSGENVFLRHPLAQSLTLMCREKGLKGARGVTATYLGAYPPAAYFRLVATAAASSMGVARNDVVSASIACHQKALVDREELGDANGRTARIECQSSRRAGGSTTIFVWPPRRD